MKPLKRLALALIPVPGLALGQDFSGTYQLGGCGGPTDGRMQIAGSQIVFRKSGCQLTKPVAVPDNGDARAFVQSGGEGPIMVRDGFASTYPRCN
jgi:hypothetical protein